VRSREVQRLLPPARHHAPPLPGGRRYSSIHVATCPAVPAGRVAVKVYDRPALSARKRNMATREAVVLRHLNACGVPHVPHLWSAYPSASQFHLVMDFFPGGDALAALAARQGRGLPEETVASQVRGGGACVGLGVARLAPGCCAPHRWARASTCTLGKRGFARRGPPPRVPGPPGLTPSPPPRPARSSPPPCSRRSRRCTPRAWSTVT
jgi:hypothetical protein